MDTLEKMVEAVAADAVMANIEDLPALAGLHEQFLHIEQAATDKTGIVSRAAAAVARLVEKIVLNDVPDKSQALAAVGDAVAAIQKIVRDHRPESDVTFPPALGLTMPAANEAGKDRTESAQGAALAAGDASLTNAPTASSDIRQISNQKPAPPSAAPDQAPAAEPLIISLENSDTSLMGEFITEAREHCANAEQLLMDLESGGDKDNAINAIFRSFHTIKGAAGFMDLKPVLVLAHESETLLDLARKGTIIMAGKAADLVFDAIDVMRKLLDGVELVMKNGGCFDGGPVTSSVLDRLRRLIENPEATEVGEPPARVGDILIDMGLVSQEAIDTALAQKKRVNERLGETLIRQGLVPAKAVARALREQQAKKTVVGSVVKEVVKVDTERLDRLIDTIGELVVAESMVGQDDEILRLVSPKVARNVSHLNKITRELQEMGMAMRLVPVRATFQKLARAVRDLTHKSGKEIELVLSGEETEVDRGIVEHIGDPLMHMIRNSVDHGIESPEERVAAGKPRTGQITIKAYHKGGNVQFDICDDGRGLDRDRILAKARERGLLDGGKEPTDHEIYNLILLPGFSTAQKITDISGRGVGMDVVKKNIELMRGHLEIASVPGRGTFFCIKLPLTLAIIDGMLVKVEDERFIIPTLSIVESLSLSKETIFSVNAKARMINLRGELLPLVSVSEMFGLPPAADACVEKTVVVVEDATRRVGLIVDTLLGQRQTVIKSLGRTFAAQKWVAGGAILSDGNVGLILDVAGMVGLTGTHRATSSEHGSTPETMAQIPAAVSAV
ncbi:MAG: chemotaxis protein CheA [candidate division Zixibacteria bacterium]|nr:chemotaxis protein CheA [candidate division Zixibacteria bacterium]